MKINVWTLAISHRHGTDLTAHATEAEMDQKLADFCEEWWTHEGGEEPMPTDQAALISEYFTMADDDAAETASHDIEIVPPTDPVAAARMAVEALRLARDCLKVAEAPRALERACAALSSARGAIRSTEYRSMRKAETDIRAVIAEAYANG